jgi:hypothetical protein
VLDELLDADGPMTVQQIIDATGIDRNSVDQALHRLVEAGDALRAGRGLYVKAPPKPKAPPLLASDGKPLEQWIATLEGWYADPDSWDREIYGPGRTSPKTKFP